MLAIVADEDIRLPAPPAGLNLTRLPPAEIRPASLRHADALLVRSVTRVDRELLAGSALRFVGTATAGIDHIDTAELERRGIHLASAPGCNAEAVADWVVAAVAAWLAKDDSPRAGLGVGEAGAQFATQLESCRLGIVGYGHTGRAVHRRLAGLVRECLVYDPFVTRPDDPAGAVRDLNALGGCDIVTLHVPLTTTGAHPTRALIGADFLRGLDEGALFLNAARGEVVDAAALSAHCSRLRVGIDVWTNEPRIDPELAQRVWLATPHIAGHTREAKARGAAMIFSSLCEFFDIPSSGNADTTAPVMPADVLAGEDAFALLRQVFDLGAMSARFKQALATGDDRARVFRELRQELGGRRELAVRVLSRAGLAPATITTLEQLGLRMQ